MNVNYRADIDGLRAVAVLAVLFFHTDIPGFSGGFVGVDIFFVISGFLITSIILKELQENKFSIARFYERRIRRIFPALFPMIVLSSIAGLYLFDPSGCRELGSSITSTTLFYSNIFFMLKSGYFEPQSLQRPLLHTWSLAVEEQFYIFFPLAMIIASRYFKKQYFPLLLITALISLLVSIYGLSHHPGATFYLVPTRAWELLAGSILALGVLPTPSSYWLQNILSLTGLGFIFYSITFYTSTTPFPGLNALAPVLGASFIIWSNPNERKTIVSTLLSLKPIVFIGLISYSLYLWHWPIVAFTKYITFRPLEGYQKLFIIVASVALATLSWWYVERPFRIKQKVVLERKRIFAISAIIMAAFSGFGLIIQLMTTDKNAYNYTAQLPENFNNLSVAPTLGAKNVTPSFALWGDSHARSFIPALEEECKKYTLSGVILTHDSAPPLLGIDVKTLPDNTYNTLDKAQYNKGVLDYLKQHPEIKTIILASRWAAYSTGSSYKEEDYLVYSLKDTYREYNGKQLNSILFKTGLSRTVNALIAMDRKVIIVGDVPEIGYNVPRYSLIQKKLPFAVKGVDIRPSIAEYNQRNREVQETLNELAKHKNVTVIHTESKMFDEHGMGKIAFQGELLYSDDDHLSTFGSLYVASSFDKVFKDMKNK